MLEEMVNAVRAGEVKPTELVERALQRIDELDGPINSVVARRDEEALAEAAAVSTDGALAGVPVLVKDLNSVAGMRRTKGSMLLADAPPDDADDPVVGRLRAAGAIVVGKTNTPAYGHTAFTSNLVFGPTKNPWNLERSPGGSSGGSGAALAAGLAPLATTTDGGGSVRIPASLCGQVGYKSTIGVIGRQGAPSWLTFSANGCTNATVADVLYEADVIAGPVPGDLQSLPAGSVARQPVRPGRVIATPSFRADVDRPIRDAYDTTLRVVERDLGIPVEVVDNPIPPTVGLVWFTISSAELAESLRPFRDRWDELDPGLRDILLFGESVALVDYIAYQRERYELCRRLDELVGDDAVLVTPTLNVLAWPPEGPLPDHAGDVTGDPTIAVNTLDLNVTGHPAVSVPIGVDPDGVPMGLQVIGPRWRDGLALGLAAALEQAQPWPRVAPGYEPFFA
jgi:Asp-tRNA(Asn)/Glu-tRNA(Gln) amidotransferase A subunit family amidase